MPVEIREEICRTEIWSWFSPGLSQAALAYFFLRHGFFIRNWQDLRTRVIIITRFIGLIWTDFDSLKSFEKIYLVGSAARLISALFSIADHIRVNDLRRNKCLKHSFFNRINFVISRIMLKAVVVLPAVRYKNCNFFLQYFIERRKREWYLGTVNEGLLIF